MADKKFRHIYNDLVNDGARFYVMGEQAKSFEHFSNYIKQIDAELMEKA